MSFEKGWIFFLILPGMFMHPIIWLQISSGQLHFSWHWIPKLGYLQGFVQCEPWYPTLQSRRIDFFE